MRYGVTIPMIPLLVWLTTMVMGLSAAPVAAGEHWFETFKRRASPTELYRFLYALPKGGDLHNHITGSVHPEWYLDLALDAAEDGYEYYTKVRIENCHAGGDAFGHSPYLLLYRNITERDYQLLDDCERAEFVPLVEMTPEQRSHWLNALRLDQPHEGRAEFFEAHWTRLSGLLVNPHLVAEIIVRNMQAFAAEGLVYLEAQVPVLGLETPDGQPLSSEQVLDIYRARLARADARETGVTLRMQVSVLRFHPDAEAHLRLLYTLAAAQPDVVAVNLVGREDNDKGYPLRFLDTLRELRRRYHGVHLSIHAGEVDEPNRHVRDTLLLGADRIGHGVNLITDPDTLLMMRHGPYLVEINLVSNLLLEYVDSYQNHPFPEYLRLGVPVALSTDDRGMWDSTLTDEFFVAVSEFNLSWEELRRVIRNSIAYGFLEDAAKQDLLRKLERRLERFESAFIRGGLEALESGAPVYRGFICRRYQLCGMELDKS